MAPTGKGVGASNSQPSIKPQQSNGVITSNPPPGKASVNRKKQKRRDKQAARQAAAQDSQGHDSEYDLHDPRADELPPPQSFAGSPHGPPDPHYQYNSYLASSAGYDHPDSGDIAYSDTEPAYNYDSLRGGAPRDDLSVGPSKKKKKKKVARTDSYDETPEPPFRENIQQQARLPPPPPPPISDAALNTVRRSVTKDPIWDTSTQEERSRIKEFWLSLGEDERKSLVKIEKEAVLRKMKEQQKHSCSCTVCGRKRTAIEEELEVLYDAYYEELEQYANQNTQQLSDQGTPMLPPGGFPQSRDRLPPDRGYLSTQNRVREVEDDVEDDSQEGDSYDDEGSPLDYEDDYSGDDTDDLHNNPSAQDFFTFGNSLTVKGGILTVADDLLKNDGQKFIDMMEQLAERRMQREEEAQFPASYSYRGAHPTMNPPQSQVPPNNAGSPAADEDEYDDEEDDEDYDSQEEALEEELEEMDQMTEEQRMEEGRRMFQIFAARMFEQRVLTAYREKVARERQQKLIEELEADDLAASQRDAKKARDAEKKKAKKQQQKQAKAEEKARKDEQKAAEEAAVKQAEAQRQEEQRRKREEQKKKKESERRAQEEEKARKEAEKQRRLQEERNRQQEAEKKAREQKAEEKRKREEARQREREEREAKELALRQAKTQQEQQRKPREDKDSGHPTKHGAEHGHQRQAPTDNLKRHATPHAAVALPPSLKSQISQNSLSSPQTKVATPILPKELNANRNRELSNAYTQAGTPQSPESGAASNYSTPPKSSMQPNATNLAPQLTRTPHRAPSMTQPQTKSPTSGIVPPPGMTNHQASGYGSGSVNQGTMNGYPPSGPMMQNQQSMPFGRQAMTPVYPTQQGYLSRGFAAQPMGPSPPGIASPSLGYPGRGFVPEPVHGFHQHSTPMSGPPGLQPNNSMVHERAVVHSRQASRSHDIHRQDAEANMNAANQPIARPGPIGRPASTKPPEPMNESDTNADIDDINRHLGSSALLDDSDEPLPLNENRRPNAAPGAAPGAPTPTAMIGSPFNVPNYTRQHPVDSWRAPGSFGHNNLSTPPGWGNTVPGAGWGAVPNSMGRHVQPRAGHSRPVAVRVLAVQACKRLSQQKPGINGFYHDINDVLRFMDSIRNMEAPIQMNELVQILDTEGDSHNGGGSFASQPEHNSMRWVPDGAALGQAASGIGLGVGEIGSPFVDRGLGAGTF